MNRLQFQSSSHLDWVTSHLRSQIVILHEMLGVIESSHSYEQDYIMTSIKSVEKELHRLRKFIDS